MMFFYTLFIIAVGFCALPINGYGATLAEQAQTALADLHGFAEYGYGSRLQSDDREGHQTTYHETRVQLEYGTSFDLFDLQIKDDILYDAFNGELDMDLREAYIYLYPADWLDLKIGRQILTWGTGDFLFINDLFPKGWRSFFIGRDDEYLKAPSTSIKASVYPSIFDTDFTLDLVWTPWFTPDRYITGDRLSYYNPLFDSKAGHSERISTHTPDRNLENSQFFARLSKNISGTELAIYFYKGLFTRPLGFDQIRNLNTFPALVVYGTSIRRTALGGIGNIEFGYYDSIDDRHGANSLIPNSQLRFLVGYNREIVKDFSLGLQYYVEYMLDYNRYERTYPIREIQADRARHLVTMRLTSLLMLETLKISLFTFYSPTDEDAYLRPSIHYKWNDHLDTTIGGNIFIGREEHTFFGQLEDDTNVFVRIRYSF